MASARARIPPPNVNPSPCGLVVDRHVPKTAGTTVRSFLRRNQQLGNCEYLGYDVGRTWQSRVGFSHKSLTELKRELNRPPMAPRRICMEAHMVNEDFWTDLAALRASSFITAPHMRCALVVVVRVREPLSWYRSYFNWAVLSRQRTGHVKAWGANFTDWLPPNMQSRFMLHGTFGRGSEWAVEMAKTSRWVAPRLTTQRWEALERIVRSADVAAPLDRLDDSLRLVRHHSGFLNSTDYVTLKPAPMHGPWERLPKLMQVDTAEQFCARRGVDCSAAVRAAAPDDHRLYELVMKLFDAQWRAHLGDLATSSHSATTTARDDDHSGTHRQRSWARAGAERRAGARRRAWARRLAETRAGSQ